VVLGISMAREGYEDYQRYRSDQELNHRTSTQVKRKGQFTRVEWSKVCVGDVCWVEEDELFPADLVLLASSGEGGIAFIETASLDGEKNLKPRNAHKNTVYYSNEKLLNELKGEWRGQVPDKELHRFSSSMSVGDVTTIYEGDKQLLYRGARLKNTKWVYGLVIYTGKNSKIMMNSESSS
jgi:magnesium-transporting ATPase (P-type)